MNSMPVLESIDALAFHDLHSLEHLEVQHSPNLRHIHPLAFRDNIQQVYTPLSLQGQYTAGIYTPSGTIYSRYIHPFRDNIQQVYTPPSL